MVLGISMNLSVGVHYGD